MHRRLVTRGDCRKHCLKHRKARVSKVRGRTSNAKPKDWYLTASLKRETRTISPGHTISLSLTSQKNARSQELSYMLDTVTGQEMLVLQIIKKLLPSDSQPYLQFAINSIRYDETFSSYISNIVNKIKVQMEGCLFDPSDSLYIISFPGTLKLAWNTNRIHEGAAMWVLSFL